MFVQSDLAKLQTTQILEIMRMFILCLILCCSFDQLTCFGYQFCLANIVELMKGIPSPCYQLATNFSWGFSLVFDYCNASIV